MLSDSRIGPGAPKGRASRQGRQRGSHRFAAGLCVAALLPGGAMVVAGCGSGSNSSASGGAAVQAQLDRARKEGAAQARRDQKVHDLQREVNQLRTAKAHTRTETVVKHVTSAAASPAVSTSDDAHLFHAPSGNVTCRIAADTASCAVASLGRSFVLDATGSAFTQDGLVLSRGEGPLLDYGQSTTVGAITCSVPPSSSPHGITCISTTGHGFEASRLDARQRAY